MGSVHFLRTRRYTTDICKISRYFQNVRSIFDKKKYSGKVFVILTGLETIKFVKHGHYQQFKTIDTLITTIEEHIK